MAHFAEIKSDTNEVIRVIVVGNDQCVANGGENSTELEQWVASNHPPNELQIQEYFDGTWPNTYWKRTSYNTRKGIHKKGGTPFRGNFAAPGHIYYADEDYFYGPKPHNSWVWDAEKFGWISPTGDPTIYTYTDGEDQKYYHIEWSEDDLKWHATDGNSNKFEWNNGTSQWDSV